MEERISSIIKQKEDFSVLFWGKRWSYEKAEVFFHVLVL